MEHWIKLFTLYLVTRFYNRVLTPVTFGNLSFSSTRSCHCPQTPHDLESSVIFCPFLPIVELVWSPDFLLDHRDSRFPELGSTQTEVKATLWTSQPCSLETILYCSTFPSIAPVFSLTYESANVLYILLFLISPLIYITTSPCAILYRNSL